MTRSIRSHRYQPLLIGAAVYALALCMWQSVVFPLLSSDPRGTVQRGELLPEGDELGPFYLMGEQREQDVLVVGDSRARKALLPGYLADFGRVGLLWGPGGQLRGLLPIAESLQPERLIVCLSPLSVYSATAAEFQTSFWAERSPFMRRVDANLSSALLELRVRCLDLVASDLWRRGWDFPFNPKRNSASYKRQLREETRAQRGIEFALLEQSLRSLVSEGIEVICVRLPISRELMGVEQSDRRLRVYGQMCARVGVPYLDYSLEDYVTYDGSHLARDEAERLSRALVADLRKRGW
jgi:hypothetical protein